MLTAILALVLRLIAVGTVMADIDPVLGPWSAFIRLPAAARRMSEPVYLKTNSGEYEEVVLVA